mmetsp:Transcript_25389/g.48031  ORF Transcript_25389/g.48031 Transcript_25389/m.48031 type:complete len:218 (-) Transcript_25389:143-796(-)
MLRTEMSFSISANIGNTFVAGAWLGSVGSLATLAPGLLDATTALGSSMPRTNTFRRVPSFSLLAKEVKAEPFLITNLAFLATSGWLILAANASFRSEKIAVLFTCTTISVSPSVACLMETSTISTTSGAAGTATGSSTTATGSSFSGAMPKNAPGVMRSMDSTSAAFSATAALSLLSLTRVLSLSTSASTPARPPAFCTAWAVSCVRPSCSVMPPRL